LLYAGATAGNAVVARLVAGRAAAQLTRQTAPAAAPAAEKHSVTPLDKGRLDNAKQLVDKAKVNKDAALSALTRYSNEAPGLLTTLKANADKDLEQFKAVTQHVNYIISEAKEIAKIQDEAISMIVGQALGGVGTVLGRISEEAAQQYERIKESWNEAKEDFMLGELGGIAQKGVQGDGEAPADSPGDPVAKELEFYKSFASLHARSTSILGVGVSVGKLSEPIGKVEDAIAGILDSGQTRSDYPLDKIEHDAAALESSSRGLATSASTVTNLIGELKGTVDQARASSPKDDKEAEKQVWKHWAAGLSHGTDYSTLDLDPIENYLKKIGIWKDLGIDIGSWFSAEEQILAVGSARAQEWVMAAREPIVFKPAVFPKVRLNGVRGASEFSARLDQSSTVFSSKVRAVVIGAETIGAEGALDTDILKQVARTPDGGYNADAIAEYLIRNGYVRVVLRGYEDLSEEDNKGGDGSGGGAGGDGAPEQPPSSP